MYKTIVRNIERRSSGKFVKNNDIPAGYGGVIHEPNENDVLSGRGGRINSHSGNIKFRRLVGMHKHTYLAKTTKKLDKVKIANQIVQEIRNANPSGRFLKEDADSGYWVEIGDEKARKKAGQAMREKAPETRKEIDEGKVVVKPIAQTIVDVPITGSASTECVNNMSIGSATSSNSATATLSSGRRPNYLNQPNYSVRAEEFLSTEPSNYSDINYIAQQQMQQYANNVYPAHSPLGHPDPYASMSMGGRAAGYAQYAQGPGGITGGSGMLPFDFRPNATIPEHAAPPQAQKPLSPSETRQAILGANAAAFSRPFNKMPSGSSSGNSGSITMSSMGASSLKTSTSSSQPISPNQSTVETAGTKNNVVTKTSEEHRKEYMNMLESNIPQEYTTTNNNNSNNKKHSSPTANRRKQFLEQTDHDSSYLPTTLQGNDGLLQPDSGRTAGSLLRPLGMTRSRSLPGMNDTNNLSMEFSIGHLLGPDCDHDLNSTGLLLNEGGSISSGLHTSSVGSKSNSVSSDMHLPPPPTFHHDRGISQTSVDNMSIDSKATSNSSWLNGFRGMQGIESDRDSRQRFFSESSNRSMISEMSTAILGMQGLENDRDNRQRLFSDMTTRSMMSELSTDLIALDLAETDYT